MSASVLVNQRNAARLAGTTVMRLRNWDQLGILERAVPQTHRRARILYDPADVREVGEWWASTVWETTAARMLRVTTATLRAWGDEGRLTQWWPYGKRRVYLRREIEVEVERLSRLRPMTVIARDYGIAYEVLRRAVDDGTIPYEAGRAGGQLIDPRDLKPLLELKPCPVCGDPVSPGRTYHERCAPKAKEVRARAAETRRGWWASPAAETFRRKRHSDPCPNCGGPVGLSEAQARGNLKRPGQERIFCSPTCSGEYRWVMTAWRLDGLGVVVEGAVDRFCGRPLAKNPYCIARPICSKTSRVRAAPVASPFASRMAMASTATVLASSVCPARKRASAR